MNVIILGFNYKGQSSEGGCWVNRRKYYIVKYDVIDGIEAMYLKGVFNIFIA